VNLLDIGSGRGAEERRKKIEARWHTYVTLDIDGRHNPDIVANIMLMRPEHFAEFGRFDFIWASPPCQAFSVASIAKHWTGGKRAYIPKTDFAVYSQEVVTHIINLMVALNPKYGFELENPVGILRKLPCVAGLPRTTITYCQYGHPSMKPTDLWGSVPGWVPKPRCKNGADCHVSAPRGSQTGTQGKMSAVDKAIVPWGVWDSILTALEAAERLEQVAA
jgi:hypothetical protein